MREAVEAVRRDLSDLVDIESDWTGLRACVAGLGIAGFAAADALLQAGAEVLVLDSGDAERQRERGQLPVSLRQPTSSRRPLIGEFRSGVNWNSPGG
jgi:UDP-N-acetylmuramoylalanine-D-glutamate ligase